MQKDFPVTVIILLVVLFSGQSRATAQCSQTRYPERLTDHRQYRLDRIAGQAVYGEVADRGEFASASGVCVALFNRKSKQLVEVVSTESGGQFQFKNLTAGKYVLRAELGPLHEVSVPLLVSRKWRETRLLLHMRAKEDPRKSFLTLLAKLSLRRELLSMAERDQAIRHQMIKSGMAHPDKTLQKRAATIDSQNTARMKEIVRQYGWPTSELVGLDGADAAFLLVQHAEHTVHKAMLSHVKEAYRQGRLSPANYAIFLDRLLTDEGKPQLYGTRATPIERWKGKEPALYPIADEVNVDKRRAALGLAPLSEYLKWLKQMYFPER